MRRERSDVEIFARTRALTASLVIYLATVGFLVLGDSLYAGTEHHIYSRLAAAPFLLLLVIRWLRLVRVRPPEALYEARQLMDRNRFSAARERLEHLAATLAPAQARRVNRARRLLQDGLAVPINDEIQLEIGRCSLHLGELQRAIDDLTRARTRLPTRADVAIDLADALRRYGDTGQAERVLRQSLPYMDAVDRQTLLADPELMGLLGGQPLPVRSVFRRRIILERVFFYVLLATAVIHGAHLYLGIF